MSRPDLRVDVKLLDPRLRDQPPHYATTGSAGLDLRPASTCGLASPNRLKSGLGKRC